jgi:hypothetical protein
VAAIPTTEGRIAKCSDFKHCYSSACR